MYFLNCKIHVAGELQWKTKLHKRKLYSGNGLYHSHYIFNLCDSYLKVQKQKHLQQNRGIQEAPKLERRLYATSVIICIIWPRVTSAWVFNAVTDAARFFSRNAWRVDGASVWGQAAHVAYSVDFIYLFICGLFNDTFSSFGYIVSILHLGIPRR
jgi:hypothetical protein